jgi:site-specific recombinase XerD
MNLRAKCDEYLDHLENVQRVTPATLKNYRSTINKFYAWATANNVPLDEKGIAAYVSSIEHAPSANTILVRLKGLARYQEVPVKRLCAAKTEIKQIEALDSSELTSLLRVTEDHDPRIHAVAVLLSGTGLRFDEFCSIRRDDLRYTEKGACYIEVMGKGRKQRIVPISESVREVWDDLPFQPKESHQDLIRIALKGAGRIAQLPIEVHPHLLRKSFISIALNEREQEPLYVAKVVGHSNLNTMLKHYYKASADKLYSVV